LILPELASGLTCGTSFVGGRKSARQEAL